MKPDVKRLACREWTRRDGARDEVTALQRRLIRVIGNFWIFYEGYTEFRSRLGKAQSNVVLFSHLAQWVINIP